MKPGQNNRRQRGRGRNKPNQGFSPNRVYESNGPEVKVRGTAAQVLEKYQALARDAQSAGDRVMAENFLQHAEHYQRLLNAMQEHMQAEQAQRDEERAAREEARQVNGHGPNQDQGHHDHHRQADEPREHGQAAEVSRNIDRDDEQLKDLAQEPMSGDGHDVEEAPKRRRGRPPKVKPEQDPAEAKQPSMLANGAE
jgi:hypothetical protein